MREDIIERLEALDRLSHVDIVHILKRGTANVLFYDENVGLALEHDCGTVFSVPFRERGLETLYEAMKEASEDSCEKIWRLPADQELFEVLRSEVADLKNSNPGNTMGGGTIVAGLFIREFTEGKPWIHVDMAPVNWLAEGNSYSIRGGTGYGVSLLYETVKNLL